MQERNRVNNVCKTMGIKKRKSEREKERDTRKRREKETETETTNEMVQVVHYVGTSTL